ncbi:hypothetical protein Zmor_009418 [Zophobas morio]|uniref:RING-type E3 ubiquitin transferase n=1 Tax=Zophobas morio TaxID=2755281 RepID=A0AA38ILN4_9CUCU|nr:hypothetical protein Zmor_009418 [Zophobas morio]
MDLDLFTESSKKSLRCATCSNYLSYFPIRLLENSDNICGRCLPPPNQPHFRNTVYEKACLGLKFPCIYEEDGCRTKLFPLDIPQHEDTCPCKTPCPLTSVHCSWKGHFSQLLQHCRSNHPNMFLDHSEFDLDLAKSHENESLLEQNSKVVLVIRRKYDSSQKLVTFSVSHSGDRSLKYFCQITFTSGDRNFQIECDAYSFRENKSGDVVFEVNDDAVQRVAVLESQTSSVSSRMNDEMLSVLKCSDCLEFALPPVYQFSGNVIRCFECREKILAKGMSDEGMRSFSVDNVANKLDYPCKYRKYGCTFTSKADVMKNHLKSCVYLAYDCPLRAVAKCEWKGVQNDLLSHLRAEHNHLLSTPTGRSVNFSFLANSKFEQCGVIYAFNRLFKYSFTMKLFKHFWVVELLGQPQCTFKCEFKLYNAKKISNSLSFQQMYVQNRQLLGFSNSYLPHDQIKPFITGNTINVTISIDL